MPPLAGLTTRPRLVLGEGEPLALLSMPVRPYGLTGTALRAAFRSRSAVDVRKAPTSPNGHGPPGRPLDRRQRERAQPFRSGARKGVPAILPPKPPIPSPARFCQRKRHGTGRRCDGTKKSFPQLLTQKQGGLSLFQQVFHRRSTYESRSFPAPSGIYRPRP